MRTGFGRRAALRRTELRMSQAEFARLSEIAPARVSNLEHGRTNIGDDVMSQYIRILQADGSLAHELRQLQSISNSLLSNSSDPKALREAKALLDGLSDKLSGEDFEWIKSRIAARGNVELPSLLYASNKVKRSKPRVSRKNPWDEMGPERFAEICVSALDLRRELFKDYEPVKFDILLDYIAAQNLRFDYEIVESLPAQIEGAFAAIFGHSSGHTILFEEERFVSACAGVHFLRHVIAHEIAHHFLHAESLLSEDGLFLPVQEMAKRRPVDLRPEEQIRVDIPTLEEAEAELFATALIVPWEKLLEGTELLFLSKDYGEQLGAVQAFRRRWNQKAVLEAFATIVFDRGKIKHPIYDYLSEERWHPRHC